MNISPIKVLCSMSNHFESSKTEPFVLDREDAQLFLEALSQPVVFNDAMTKALKAHDEIMQSRLP